jgi:hypothetical protein
MKRRCRLRALLRTASVASRRLPAPNETETAWRERPLLWAAGVIADPAKSSGRSRHGSAIDRLADRVEFMRAAKGAAQCSRSQIALLREVGTKHPHAKSLLYRS